jgi:hypothetical protein
VARGRAADFRVAFAHTLRRVDRLQPALLAVCLLSTIGFALGADRQTQVPALLAAVGFLAVLVGSGALLVPVQRRLVQVDLPSPEAERLRKLWLRGHLIRTVVAVAALVLAVIAAIA